MTAKDLKTGGVGKTGLIGAICHKNAANVFKHNKPSGPWAGRGGTAQLSRRSKNLELFAPGSANLMAAFVEISDLDGDQFPFAINDPKI